MIEFIILAAGKGTRMGSDMPKALIEAKGKMLIEYALETVGSFSVRPHVVVGHKGEMVESLFGHKVNLVWQHEQKGTGHAVLTAKDKLEKSPAKHIIVLFADQPLVSRRSIESLIRAREEASAVFSLATVQPEHHEGDFAVFRNMGRIVRDEGGAVQAIVEYKDASDGVRAIKEVNSSVYCFDPEWLWQNIGLIESENAAKEYYLTDLVAIARAQKRKVIPVILPTEEGMGANTVDELRIIERHL